MTNCMRFLTTAVVLAAAAHTATATSAESPAFSLKNYPKSHIGEPGYLPCMGKDIDKTECKGKNVPVKTSSAVTEMGEAVFILIYQTAENDPDAKNLIATLEIPRDKFDGFAAGTGNNTLVESHFHSTLKTGN